MPDWIYWISVFGVIYLGLCLIFYFFQDYFFFRPELLPVNFEYKYPFPFDEVHFEMEDGAYVNGLHFKVPNSRGVIYYLKGNSKSVKGWGKFARDFIGKGYDFFMVDYRGFGKSRGKRDEVRLFNDAQHIYKWLYERYPEEEIVIYGRSLGSGIAARIASWNKPKMLILDSPYFSFLQNTMRYGFFLPIKFLLRYHIRTDQFLKNIKLPVYLIHGTKDRLFPFSASENLKAVNPESITLYPIEGAGHNNLHTFPEYHDILYELLNDKKYWREVKAQSALK